MMRSDTRLVMRLCDEMVLVLSYEGDEIFDEQQVRDKVRQALRGLVYGTREKPYPIGASIGIAYRGRNEAFGDEVDVGKMARAILDEADRYMYADKGGKKERYKKAVADAQQFLVGDTPSAKPSA